MSEERLELPPGPEVRPPRRILLVDCDQFYVQVARIADPEGAGREPLLIVGGSADGRGVVTSASYEVRRYGVRSAMPTARALRLCPDAVVVSVPREACSHKSRAIRRLLERLSPVVQPASIDEFYLDLSGTERLLEGETLQESAARIREAVLDETRISVSVGGGTRRMIAKLAAGLAKPGGVHIVPAGAEEAFMRRFDLADIPGVGPSLLASLRRRGLERVEDVLRIDREWLVRWFGEARGTWLHDRLRGIDPTAVRPGEARKSISSERTFASDLTSGRALAGELLRLVGFVGKTLRSQGLRARTVTLKVRDDDFVTHQRSHTLPDPVESDATLHSVAAGLLAEVRREMRRPVRLLGVGVSGLVDSGDPEQLALFEDGTGSERDRDRRLSRVLDDLRGRFGHDAVLPGAVLDRDGRREG